MNRGDQRKITKNLAAIKKTLRQDIDAVIEQLVLAHVFPMDVKTEVRNLRPAVPQLRCGWMVNRLLRSGPDAFRKFLQILREMGKHSLVQILEKASIPDNDGQSVLPGREKTFIIPSPRIPENFADRLGDVTKDRETPKPLDEVVQLERMMTIVLTTLDEKSSNKNRLVDNRRDQLHQRLLTESKGNDELMGFFKSLRSNRCSLTAHSLKA